MFWLLRCSGACSIYNFTRKQKQGTASAHPSAAWLLQPATRSSNPSTPAHLAAPQQVAGQHAASTHIQHASQGCQRAALPNLEPRAHRQRRRLGCRSAAAAAAGWSTAPAAAVVAAAAGQGCCCLTYGITTAALLSVCCCWFRGRKRGCIAVWQVLPQRCQVGFAIQSQAVLQHVLRLCQPGGQQALQVQRWRGGSTCSN